MLKKVEGNMNTERWRDGRHRQLPIGTSERKNIVSKMKKILNEINYIRNYQRKHQ